MEGPNSLDSIDPFQLRHAMSLAGLLRVDRSCQRRKARLTNAVRNDLQRVSRNVLTPNVVFYLHLMPLTSFTPRISTSLSGASLAVHDIPRSSTILAQSKQC